MKMKYINQLSTLRRAALCRSHHTLCYHQQGFNSKRLEVLGRWSSQLAEYLWPRIQVVSIYTHQIFNYSVNKIGRTLKSHTCGELSKSNVGEVVVLRGFLQFQRYGKFIVIRDSYGATQAVISDHDSAMKKEVTDTCFESYIEISGTVQDRPENQCNPKMKTGDIEIIVNKYFVLNKSSLDIPILSREKTMPTELIRMKYRYLHLRSEQMQHILKLRSITSKKIRDFLQDEMGFTEVTTPTLSVNTPGGAQEFIVPTKYPQQFYSLVQSPQTFKQLLMVGGIDKYFQFAVCYRDETGKPERQPEFTQVDLEMSDITMKEIQHLTEKMIIACWPSDLTPPEHFPQMTYEQALHEYGSDKPDTRFGWKLKDVTNCIKNCGLKFLDDSLDKPCVTAHAFVIPQGQTCITNKMNKEWNKLAMVEFKLKDVLTLAVTDDLSFKGSIGKKLSASSISSLIETTSAKPLDTIVLVTGPTTEALTLLGRIRLLAVKHVEDSGTPVRDLNSFNFLWIVDFPMFESDPDSGQLISVHHPFTRPKDEDLHLVSTNPLQVKSQGYDLVLNGSEIAGGSIRIHEPDLQKHILDILGIEPGSLGFFFEALSYGAPPHGGIAIGYDRLIALLCQKVNIREVMAFPKASSGKCLMTNAPSTVSEEERLLYHLGQTTR